MKRILITVFLALFVLNSGLSWAGRSPVETDQDDRVRTVGYSAKDIVKLTIHTGIGTGIQFEADEEYDDHYSGIDAFHIKPMPNGLVSLKPKIKYADTNLTIITNKRVYLYEIKLRDPKTNRHGLNDVTDKNLTYHLFYSYPEQENRLAKAKYKAGIARDKANYAAQCNDNERVDPSTLDFGYSLSGTRNISPVAVYDNGTFTYLKFHRDTPIPAIFTVDERNNETVVNKTMHGDTVVVQQLAGRFTLRHGSDVVTIVKRQQFAPHNQVKRKDEGANYAGW